MELCPFICSTMTETADYKQTCWVGQGRGARDGFPEGRKKKEPRNPKGYTFGFSCRVSCRLWVRSRSNREIKLPYSRGKMPLVP